MSDGHIQHSNANLPLKIGQQRNLVGNGLESVAIQPQPMKSEEHKKRTQCRTPYRVSCTNENSSTGQRSILLSKRYNLVRCGRLRPEKKRANKQKRAQLCHSRSRLCCETVQPLGNSSAVEGLPAPNQLSHCHSDTAPLPRWRFLRVRLSSANDGPNFGNLSFCLANKNAKVSVR